MIGLFCEAEDARALRDQLYEWYKVEPFPTYQPEIESVTTVANSVLCADSVGAYMEATGYAMSDPGPSGPLRRPERRGGRQDH